LCLRYLIRVTSSIGNRLVRHAHRRSSPRGRIETNSYGDRVSRRGYQIEAPQRLVSIIATTASWQLAEGWRY
jgi:hypothetical protein